MSKAELRMLNNLFPLYKIRYQSHWSGNSYHVFIRHNLFFYKYFVSFETLKKAEEHVAKWLKLNS